MRTVLILLALTVLLSCGKAIEDEDLNNYNDTQNNADSPMTVAMKSPSCTLSLGKYGMPLVTVCASGYYYENGEKMYANEPDCMEGTTLVGEYDLGLDVLNAKFSHTGCKNYGNTLLRCYVNDDRGNIYSLTSSNVPVSPTLLNRAKDACEANGGEFKTIKLNDM